MPSDIYVDYLQYHFAAKLPAHAGWVIVGFPTVREHAHRLCEAELQPHRVIVIAREVENDVKDVVEGLERASIGWSQVNPETTKDIDSLIDRVADVFYSSAGMSGEY